MRVLGGATAYIFAGMGYGDRSELMVKGEVPDLGEKKLGVGAANGDGGSLSGNVKGVWIVGPDEPRRRRRRRGTIEEKSTMGQISNSK